MAMFPDHLRLLEDFNKNDSQDAATFQGSRCPQDGAVSAFEDDPPDLLGLSAAPSYMASHGSKGLNTSPAQESDINFAAHGLHFLDHGSSGSHTGWSIPLSESGNENPIRRFAAQAPNASPWNSDRVNLPSNSPFSPGPAPISSSNVSRGKIGRQQSLAGSHANFTDPGYYTASQADATSVHSRGSGRNQNLSAASSSPHTASSIQTKPKPIGMGASRPVPADSDPLHPSDSMNSSQPQLDHVCEEENCNFAAKNKSDLKKHIARHRLEHRCDDQLCTRQKGFATSNDLERHRSSVHHIGNKRYWKCFGQQCKHPLKTWPRRDNFKQHLTRMHSNEDKAGLLKRADDWYEANPPQEQLMIQTETPGMPSGLSQRATEHQQYIVSPSNLSDGLLSPGWKSTRLRGAGQQAHLQRGTRPRQSSLNHQSPTSRVPPHMYPEYSKKFQYQSGDWPGELIDSGILGLPNGQATTSSFADPLRQPLARRSHARTMPNPEVSKVADITDAAPSPGDFSPDTVDFAYIAGNLSSSLGEAPPTDDLGGSSLFAARAPESDTDLLTWEYLKELLGRSSDVNANHTKILEEVFNVGLEKYKEARMVSSMKSSSSVTGSLSSSHKSSNECTKRYKCTESLCDQWFPRQSELKKHTSRHTRPFGCTYPGCYDKFGSKWDWKRHESTQHIQEQCWRCDVPRSGSEAGQSPCGRFFWKEPLFTKHLEREHFIRKSDEVQEKIQNRKIGPGCSVSFWCGFCEDIVPLAYKAEHAAAERFDHIHCHFKEKRNILDWVELAEGGLLKRDMKSQYPRKPREEGDHADDTSQEDSEDVLMSDAIPGSRVETSTGGRSLQNRSFQFSQPALPQLGRKRSHNTLGDAMSSSQSAAKKTKKQDKSSASKLYYYVCCTCRESEHSLSLNPSCPSCLHAPCQHCEYRAAKDDLSFP